GPRPHVPLLYDDHAPRREGQRLEAVVVPVRRPRPAVNAVVTYNGGMANMDKNGLFNQQKISRSIDQMVGKPVRRSHSNKWVAGVCGGIEEATGFNVTAL